MARIETGVEDLQETARPPVVETRAPTAKLVGDQPESPSEVPSRRFSRWILLLAATIAVAGASVWWVRSQNYESTDDAQIEGHLDLVSSRISGTVAYINPRVENNQLVEAGTLLMELDPRDYAAELEHAKANLATRAAEAHSAKVTVPIVDAGAFGQLHSAEAAKAQALASVASEQANLAAAQHKLQQDEAIYARAERDRVRYQALVEKHEISRSDYDARETEATSAAQSVEADRAAITSREQRIAETRSLVDQREAQIEAARIAPQQVTDARAKSDSATGHLEQSRADALVMNRQPRHLDERANGAGCVGMREHDAVDAGREHLAEHPRVRAHRSL